MSDALSPDVLEKMDAYWRAANYLTVGQIYLQDNPLLEAPLAIEHIKPRLLGHWGTTPGLNFIYAHLNRVIRRDDLDMIFITGPGHGGPAHPPLGDGLGGVELFGARRGQRQHLHVDAGGVHRRDAARADVAQRPDELGGAVLELARRLFQIDSGTVQKERCSKMLLERDDAHGCSFLRRGRL